MARRKPLGTAQRATLAALYEVGGTWDVNSRPLYESRYWTLRLLGSLAQADCVREVIPDEKYELTDEGNMRLTLG